MEGVAALEDGLGVVAALTPDGGLVLVLPHEEGALHLRGVLVWLQDSLRRGLLDLGDVALAEVDDALPSNQNSLNHIMVENQGGGRTRREG